MATQKSSKTANRITSHTPGPWYVVDDRPMFGILSKHRFGANDPEVICQIGQDIMCPQSEEEAAANAHLIAAAPDLLEILRYTYSLYREAARMAGHPGVTIPAVEQAIAKAEGRE